MQLVDILSIAIGLVFLLLLLVFVFVSLKENEPRAARKAFLCTLFVPPLFFVIGLLDYSYMNTVAAIMVSVVVFAAIVFLLPMKLRIIPEDDTPKVRIDERDTMFSRYYSDAELEKVRRYYENNPDKNNIDSKIKSKPGILNKRAAYYKPFTFSAARSNFTAVKSYHAIIDKRHEGEIIETDPAALSIFIKKWAVKAGAVSIGITELKDYHLYSVLGRDERYGKKGDLDHKYAIAITVEMDKHLMDYAPYGPVVMESSQQYLKCGTIAIQIAEFIRNLGFEARAHIDGNYYVVCPLVARDAGLGEIGRMGLLMTPQLGPRVRISVVTTEIPLIVDKKTRDYSMIDFCRKCKKCAEVCPGKAISFEDRIEIDGVKRWQINSEDCFSYWCSVGTDCGRCITVCPYSHPDNLIHNIVRKGVRNSFLFRKYAIKMDNFFYGKKPLPSKLPEWLDSGIYC